MEAFGNAKTIRNNNSSRFGKFIEIHYTNKFTVVGGLFLHYLLEKSRICTQSDGERNYHIFYQLCACLPQKQWQELSLDAPDKFRYLSGGCTQYFCSRQSDSQLDKERKSQAHTEYGSIQDQLIDDMRCYEQMDLALSNFGIDDEQKAAIYSIVGSVLHLGNITFCEDSEDSRGGCKIESGAAERALEITSRLIKLDKDSLRQALTTRVMSTSRGGHKGTIYMVSLTFQQAQAARDALAKAIYSKLFDHIVTKIVNKSIPFSNSSYYIGVLDVAGFEYFQHNNFEQFLINFCNEKLQQFFNQRILKEEQNIYEKEGLDLRRVEFVDNQDCLQLFETKSTGIFDLLDEESRLPKPNAQHFTQSVHSVNKGHFRLAVPRSSKLKSHREILDDEGFLIRHFAGAVCYETNSFIEKNNDALHASLKNLMLEAGHELLRDLFTDRAQSDRSTKSSQLQVHTANYHQPVNSNNKLNFISVGTTFRSQLNDLMCKLRSTGSHFIRCIKPNSEMVAHKFEGGQILSQLHCSGMDSVLKLMQQGYPSRSSFNDIYQTYKQLLPAELARLDSHLFCRALFKAIGLADSDFRFGSSKVFFRPGKFGEFDEIIRSDGEHVAKLVKRVTRWLLRSRWRKVQYCALSVVKLDRKILYRRDLIIKIQRNWRMAIVARALKFRLNAIRSSHGIIKSLHEFEQIGAKELGKLNPETSKKLAEETKILKREVESFITRLTIEIQQFNSSSCNNNYSQQLDSSSTKVSPSEESRRSCQDELNKLLTKRDLLVRSIKDKIKEQKELNELERRVKEENKRREEEELAKRREVAIKQQRNELEARRQAEVGQASRDLTGTIKRRAPQTGDRSTRVEESHNATKGNEDQEQRDYEIALRLSREQPTNSVTERTRTPLAPSENLAGRSLDTQYDLTRWKYSDLRDTINTSCDLELLEACKREFHRRLKVYHAWRAANSRLSQGSESSMEMRAPSSVMDNLENETLKGEARGQLGGNRNEQRYFRIPFVKNSLSSGQRGWWFAHFDGQWIARQLELHPDREPILLIAGQHDIDMCELSLQETRLTSKRGAEILPQEFEEEWTKHGGKAYTRGSIK